MVSTSQAGVFHGRTPATDVHRPAAGPHVHLYRKNFLLFVGIATVGPAANAIFQILTVGADVGAPFGSRRAATGAATLATTGLGVIVGYVIMLAGMALSHAATVKAVAAVYLGRETSVIGAYKALRGRIWSLFGTFGLIVLIVVAALVAVVIVTVLVTAFGLVEITGAGTAGAVVRVLVMAALALAAFMAIYVRYALAIQACVVEGMVHARL